MKHARLVLSYTLVFALSANILPTHSAPAVLEEEEVFLAKLGRFVLNELRSDESLQNLLNRNHRRKGEHIEKQTTRLIRELDARQNVTAQRQEAMKKLLLKSSKLQQNLNDKLDVVISILRRKVSPTATSTLGNETTAANTTLMPSTTTAFFHKNCRPPWKLLTRDLCVAVTNNTGNWTNAESYCDRIGGRLLSFHSADEVSIVRNYIKSLTTEATTYYWLGHRYLQKQPISLHSVYIPPRSMYWTNDSDWFNECSLFYGDGDLVTWSCDYTYPNGLCRRLLY